MDEVLDRLLHVSSDGLSYVGHISVAKRAGSQGTFKPKVAKPLMMRLPCHWMLEHLGFQQHACSL